MYLSQMSILLSHLAFKYERRGERYKIRIENVQGSEEIIDLLFVRHRHRLPEVRHVHGGLI